MTISNSLTSIENIPAGVISSHVGSNPPPGWLFCDGSEIPITRYSRLYNVLTNQGISFPYGANTNGSGGVGSTHFRLPNLTNQFILHGSSGVGATGGSNTHDHPFTTNVSIANVAGGGHGHNTLNAMTFSLVDIGNVGHTVTTGNTNTGSNTTNLVAGKSNSQILATSTHTHPVSVSVTASTINHNHAPPNLTFASSSNHETDHIPNANISSYINQVTYQASSSSMTTANNPATNTKIRAIIKI